MMVIPCPFCGPRAEIEFVYDGAAGLTPPAPDDGPEAWSAYLYFRDNPKGWHRELWVHRFGCGSWLEVERHTVTHEIRRTAFADPNLEAS